MGVLTDHTPKPMLPILGKPKIAHTVEMLPECVTEVIFIVGYLGDQVRTYFGDSYAGRSIRYIEQKELNGTGGAIHLARDITREKFLVLNGDDLYHKDDLERLLAHDLALLACEVEDSSQFGVLETDHTGKLVRIIERPHDGSIKLVNTGAYVLTQSFYEYPLIPISDKEFGLPQTLIEMRQTHPIRVERATTWFPIGSPEAQADAQERIKDFL